MLLLLKMSGAERDTVGVQGPVRRGLLMYERGICGIDGCSEGMTVVDVQVVREEVGEVIHVLLLWKDGRVDSRGREAW